MSRLRRIAFWILLLLFIGVAAWWVLYIPYRPDRLYAALPANAVLVTAHDNMADRWDDLMANPLVQSLLSSAGVKSEDAAKFASDPAVRSWVRQLASREVVLAYVPALGYQRRPAWVFGSWLGGSSRRLRWKLNWARLPDFRPIRVEDGNVVYATRVQFAEPRLRLSLALNEGLLLGCVSTDPTGVRWLLKSADGLPAWPSLLSAGQYRRAAALWPAAMKDRGWLTLPEKTGVEPFAPSLLTFGLDPVPPRGMRGCVIANDALPACPDLRMAQGLEALTAFLRDTPDFFCTLPASYLAPVLPGTNSLPLLEAARGLLGTNGVTSENLVFGCLLNHEHCGRIRGPLSDALTPFMKGIKVPTILLGVRVRDEQDAHARVLQALDALNMGFRLGLIPHPVQFGAYTLTLVEDTRDSFYGHFEPDERVAFAVVDGWLVLSSNAAILKKLLSEKAGQDAKAAQAVPAWRQQMNGNSGAAYAWANFEALNKTLKDAISALTLAMVVRDAQGSLPVRQNLAVAKAWIDGLRPLGCGQMWLSSTGSISRLDVAVGPAPGTTAHQP